MALALVGLLLATGLAAVGTAQNTALAMSVTSSVSPDPITPGTTGTITLTLTNVGTTTINKVDLSYGQVPAGISLSAPDTKVSSISRNASTTTAITVSVGPDVNAGRYLIQVRSEYCGGTNPYTCNFFTHTLAIRVVDPQQAHLASVTPDTLRRSEATDLTFTFSNPTRSALQDLRLTWSTPGDALLALGEDVRLTREQVPANGTVDLTTRAVVTPSRAAGLLPLTVNISYLDPTGTTQSHSTTVGLWVEGNVAFDVGDARLENGDLTVTLANVGQDAAEGVVLRPLDAEGRELGAGFVGTLDPGDYTTVVVDLLFRNGAGEVTELRVQYTDALGQRQTTERPLTAVTLEDDAAMEATEESSGPIPGGWPVFTLLALVGLAIVLNVVRRILQDRRMDEL